MSNGPRKRASSAPVDPEEEEFDFSALVKSKARKSLHTETVDVSRFFPEFLEARGVENICFTYKELSAPDLVGLRQLTQVIKVQRPTWSDEMLGSVALLTAAHVSPVSSREQVYILYSELAERLETTQFFELLNEFTEKFPHLADYAAVLAGKKKS